VGGLLTIHVAIQRHGSVRSMALGHSGVERRGVRVKSGKESVSSHLNSQLNLDCNRRITLASLSIE